VGLSSRGLPASKPVLAPPRQPPGALPTLVCGAAAATAATLPDGGRPAGRTGHPAGRRALGPPVASLGGLGGSRQSRPPAGLQTGGLARSSARRPCPSGRQHH